MTGVQILFDVLRKFFDRTWDFSVLETRCKEYRAKLKERETGTVLNKREEQADYRQARYSLFPRSRTAGTPYLRPVSVLITADTLIELDSAFLNLH